MKDRCWQPNIGMGSIVFGDPIAQCEQQHGAFVDPGDTPDGTSWRQYQLPGTDCFLEVENGQVVAILVYDILIYQRKNIIGRKMTDIIELLGEPDEIGDSVIYDDGDIQTPYEFRHFGLQAWVSEGRVASVSICNYSM